MFFFSRASLDRRSGGDPIYPQAVCSRHRWFRCHPLAETAAQGWVDLGPVVRCHWVFEFFVFSEGASTAMRIEVPSACPRSVFFSEDHRRAGVWSQSAGIRSGMISFRLQRRCSVEEMMSQHSSVLKFRLHQMKLRHVQFLRGTCEFCASYLCVAGVGISSRPISVLTSLERWSPKIMAVDIF
jgi:hypothetical protein